MSDEFRKESLKHFLGPQQVGVDEAGRGPLAGSVFAAAVMIDPEHPILNRVKDSKALREPVREKLFDEICEAAQDYAIAEISAEVIDRVNILQASLLAMKAAIEKLSTVPQHAWIDGAQLPRDLSCPAQSLIKGDVWHPLISAASILAKVSRDRHMKKMDELYPEYGFARHKGYGTPVHLAALKKFGPCRIHRQTFSPIKYHLNGELKLLEPNGNVTSME